MDPEIHLVASIDSPEFTLLTQSLTQSSLIGLDAEWKPIRTQQSSFPTVSLLQLACQLGPRLGPDSAKSLVFLFDLSAIPLSSIYELLRDVFVSPDVLKLGFRFKQDLIYLSSTFCSQGCDPGFDRVSVLIFCDCVFDCRENGGKEGKKVNGWILHFFGVSHCVFGCRENGEKGRRKKKSMNFIWFYDPRFGYWESEEREKEMKAGMYQGFCFKRAKKEKLPQPKDMVVLCLVEWKIYVFLVL